MKTLVIVPKRKTEYATLYELYDPNDPSNLLFRHSCTNINYALKDLTSEYITCDFSMKFSRKSWLDFKYGLGGWEVKSIEDCPQYYECFPKWLDQVRQKQFMADMQIQFFGEDFLKGLAFDDSEMVVVKRSSYELLCEFMNSHPQILHKLSVFCIRKKNGTV